MYRETSPGVLAAACDSYCPVVQDTYYSTSRVVMEEGQTIWIKVSTGTKAKSGTLKFTVPARPSNDYLAGRTVLRPLGWGETETRPFTVVGATRSTDEPGAMSQPAMGPVGRASTVWYEVTANTLGVIRFATNKGHSVGFNVYEREADGTLGGVEIEAGPPVRRRERHAHCDRHPGAAGQRHQATGRGAGPVDRVDDDPGRPDQRAAHLR